MTPVPAPRPPADVARANVPPVAPADPLRFRAESVAARFTSDAPEPERARLTARLADVLEEVYRLQARPVLA